MKLTYLELAKQGKVVNASLIPHSVEYMLEWAIDDPYNAYISYVVLLDPAEKAVQIEVFKWIEEADEWISQEFINGDEAIEMAKSFNLIM